jgi:purine-binding chemotaxis protein CheW
MTESAQLCTFLVEDLYFGIDVRDVEEVIRFQPMTPVPLAAHHVRGLINLRGRVVPAIDMRRRLQMSDRGPQHLPMNIVLRTLDGPVSLLVDEIVDVVEVDPDMYEPRPEAVCGLVWHYINSIYKLPERLLLVLDTERAVSGNWAERESA